MKSAVPTLLTQWRESNRLACEAETALFEATLLYTSGQGPQPTDELTARASRLRLEAAELFDAAIAQFGQPTPYVAARPYVSPSYRQGQH